MCEDHKPTHSSHPQTRELPEKQEFMLTKKKLIMASDVTEVPRLILAVAVSVQWAASYHVLPSAETLDLQFGSVRN